MSSRLRAAACLRAWASNWLVLSSSTVTRRPRSAIRSMAFLLTFLKSLKNRSATRPALPHAELEDGEIDSFQQSSRRDHHVGGGNRILWNRSQLLAGVDACGVETAGRCQQFLQR